MVDTSDVDATDAMSEALPAILQDFMTNAVSFNEEAFANAFSMNMGEGDMRDMISSFLQGGSATYDDNLALFGYADLEDPYEIVIYPKNFESKAGVVSFIDDYNAKVLRPATRVR